MEVVGTIYLQGEDAREFIRSVFRPTQDEIDAYNRQMLELDSTITIIQNGNEFTAEIQGIEFEE